MKNLSYLSKTILLTLVVLLISACDKNSIDGISDINCKWKVVSYTDYESSTITVKTEENTWKQYNNGDVTVTFSGTSLTNGLLSGIKVTNSFSGNYSIGNNGAITISNLIQTEINEPEWGRLFDSIREAESYEVNDGHLIIYSSQRKKSITLEKIDE